MTAAPGWKHSAGEPQLVPAGRPLDCIVLVKQVPDVSNIPEDAWDREKGTLRRALLDSILNPLDLQALPFARRITEATPGSRTIYLSMGPPQRALFSVPGVLRNVGDVG